MKKLLYLLALLAVVTLALAGCNAEAEPTDTQKPSETQKQTESTDSQPTVAVSSDGYVTVNGVKTEYKVDTEDKITVDTERYLVINGVKTEYKVDTEDKVTVDTEGYLVVNGVKTEYKVDTEDKVTVDTEGYLVVNGVKTEHRVDPRKPCTFGDWQPYGDKIENCASALWFRICSDCKVLEWKEGLEHKFVTVTTKATCQAKGYDTNTCSVCGTVTKTNETPISDHDYNEDFLTDTTFHWHKCKNCDAISTKKEHTLGTDGICTVCDAILGATIGVIYDVSADGTYAEVVGYEGTAERVRIADTYENLPVKNIYSFSNFSGNKTVTEVIIPDSVTSIGDEAFRGCSGLTSITIPDSVTSIGYGAFYDCSNLTSITIPNGVTSIGNSAFRGCSSITNITIPDSVTSIGEHAFQDCSSLTSITIGNSVTSIGSYAFGGCSRLNAVYISNIKSWCNIDFCDYYMHLDSLSSNPLFYAKNLYLNGILVTNLFLQEDVTHISTGAFYNCDSLTSITIPDSVTSIGDLAFYDCSSLTSVTIGDSVTSIGDHVFEYCSNLTSITIPDSVTSIGGGAFSGCSKLNFTEYKNAKYLGNANNPHVALIEVTNKNLISYTIHKDTKVIAGYAFSGCSRMTSITIPDSVTSIGEYAFYSCDSLTSITIPDSITSIEKCAFDQCRALTSVIIFTGIKEIGEGVFSHCWALDNVYYTGTQAQWNDVSIGYFFNNFDNVDYGTVSFTITYNYVPQ